MSPFNSVPSLPPQGLDGPPGEKGDPGDVGGPVSEGTGCDAGTRGRAGEEAHWVAREVGCVIPRAPGGEPALPLWGLTMTVRSLRAEAGDGWCWVMFG